MGFTSDYTQKDVTMNRLNKILDHALSESRFDIGRVESTEGHPLRSYAVRPDEVVSVGQLRRIFEEGVREYGHDKVAKSAQLVCKEGPISELVNLLRDKLESYIDPKTDRIGHAFPPFFGFRQRRAHIFPRRSAIDDFLRYTIGILRKGLGKRFSVSRF